MILVHNVCFFGSGFKHAQGWAEYARCVEECLPASLDVVVRMTVVRAAVVALGGMVPICRVGSANGGGWSCALCSRAQLDPPQLAAATTTKLPRNSHSNNGRSTHRHYVLFILFVCWCRNIGFIAVGVDMRSSLFSVLTIYWPARRWSGTIKLPSR